MKKHCCRNTFFTSRHILFESNASIKKKKIYFTYNKENNIRNDFRVLMFQQLLENKHHEVASFEVSLRSLGLVTDKTTEKKKTRIKHEPRSAHGRAVKNIYLKKLELEKFVSIMIATKFPVSYQ